ncbi:MAG: hypothetical protein ACRDAM_21545, partial [Casimicrobium sp.]
MLVFAFNKYARFDMSEASDGDVAERYRVICGAYGDVRLDSARIPVELHDLLPLAAKYGHGDRILLEDCVVKLDSTEAKRIAAQIAEKTTQIEAWLSKYPPDFNANEVIAFRELLKLKTMLRPSNHPPAKPGALSIVSRSKRLNGVAHAAPTFCAT